MPSLEAVCAKLFGRPGWIPKVLWGGALSFVPGINLFALGYLLTYAQQIRHNRNFDLPEWSDMSIGELFMNGLKLFALLVAYIGVPLFVGWLVGILLFLFSFGFWGLSPFSRLRLPGSFPPCFCFVPCMHTSGMKNLRMHGMSGLSYALLLLTGNTSPFPSSPSGGSSSWRFRSMDFPSLSACGS